MRGPQEDGLAATDVPWRRLRILHLGFEDPMMPGAGGGSRRTHEINRRLVGAGHAVTVLTTRYPGCRARYQDGVRYVQVGAGAGRSRLTRLLGYLAGLPFAVRREAEVDLVVEDFFAPFSSMSAPLWTRRPTIGMVQWLHAGEKSVQYGLPFHLLERAGVRSHREMITVSHGVAERLEEMNPDAEVTVVGNGVDRSAFGDTPSLGRDVVFVGRLEMRGKGLDLLLPAWALACRSVDGDLVIAGTGIDEQRVRRLAGTLGVADRVRFVGWVSGAAKYALMNAARLVVVPSRQETFGLVALEALATATPVLAFDIPCLREVVPAESGWTVPPFEVEALAAKLVELYPDRDRLLAAGRTGRAFAASYDWDRLAGRQAAVYLRTVARQLTPECAGPARPRRPGGRSRAR